MSTGTQTEVVMPQMGVSVSEGTVTKWLKQVGEPIGRDEPLLEISTDKVDTEVPSPGEGVVAQILVQEGETVEVGTVIAIIAPAGAAVAEPEAPCLPAGRAGSPHRAGLRRLLRRSRSPPPSRAGAAPDPSPAPVAVPEAATGRPSSRPSSRASPPSTAWIRRSCRAPAPADG